MNYKKKLQKFLKDLLKYNLEIGEEQMSLIYTYNVQAEKTGITDLLQEFKRYWLKVKRFKNRTKYIGENIC